MLPILGVVSADSGTFSADTELIRGNSRLLVRHPEVLVRLRKEIQSVLESSQSPTREQIRKMPYLSFVIKESKYNLARNHSQIPYP